MSSKKESELNDLENSQSVHTAKTKQNKTKASLYYVNLILIKKIKHIFLLIHILITRVFGEREYILESYWLEFKFMIHLIYTSDKLG